MRALGRLVFLAGAASVIACGGGPVRPAALDTKHDACRSCRMPVSDPKVAAQLVAPGEEALFFDDIGCLRDFLGSARAPKPGAVAFVADHRTGAWVAAGDAVFSRCPAVETAMGSHLLAWADDASRSADGSAAGCVSLERTALFGAAGPPSGRKG